MARIAGVDIPRDKRIEVSLTYIYGIGLTRAKTILARTGVNPDIRVKDLEDGDIQKLREATEEYTIEGDLLIQQCPDLEGIEGFAALTDVSGNVAIGDNTALVEIVGLPVLQNVGGNLRLFRNDALDNVAGMTAVNAVTGNLEVTENAVLTSVEPLYSITGVGADLLCTDNLILPTSQCDTLVQTIGPANIGGTVTVSGNGPG